MEKLIVNVFDHEHCRFRVKSLSLHEGRWAGLEDVDDRKSELYLAPGFIDSHTHIYPGATDLGIEAEQIGLASGVHLLVDAGSAGSTNFPCFRDRIVPSYQTMVKSYLNISRIGLITKQPYYDLRNLDINAAVDCIRQDQNQLLLGIKVLSSGLVVEEQGLKPLEAALEAARLADCPVMVHLAEGPPANEEMMKLLRKGDIITHCFHGAPNIAANVDAAKGHSINQTYCQIDNIMWNSDGIPIKALQDALDRGVFLDVGHGGASFDQNVAKAAIKAGVRNFSISTDAHIRNVNTVIHSLSFTMSKFLALGMRLEDIVAGVTVIPEKQLGLNGWCNDLQKHATLFRLRRIKKTDPLMVDANKTVIPADWLIEPTAVMLNGVYQALC